MGWQPASIPSCFVTTYSLSLCVFFVFFVPFVVHDGSSEAEWSGTTKITKATKVSTEK